MKKIITAIIVCPIVFCFSLLEGCASIVSGTTQTVSVTTIPVTSATCSLTNQKGTWYIPATPSSVVIHKSGSDLNIDCQKAGYYDGFVRVKSQLRPMVAGNIIFGLSAPIGAGVDTLDGAAFNYPVNIQVPMVPK